MLPLLPFVAGLAAGALALKLWRTDKSSLKLDKAQETIRNATVSSLAAIEQSSAKMRKKLSADTAPDAKADQVAGKEATRAAAKPARKKTVVRKAAPKKLVEPKVEVVDGAAT